MRIPLQEIPIVNNHPINFERRIWAKSHPRAGSIFAKLHGKKLLILFYPNFYEFLHYFFFKAIINIIAWILLASAGVMVARYFDSVWPLYERQPVVDASGHVVGEEATLKRRFSYNTVCFYENGLFDFINLFFSRRFSHR